MSTAHTSGSVKQALLAIVRQELIPQLENLVDALPETLLDFQNAETQIRKGMLNLAQSLLEAWGGIAERSISRPCCPHCQLPMRHKGHASMPLVTTVGVIAYRRPRWRCEACTEMTAESYPHDVLVRFLQYEVSWALAKVVSRLGAQGPFEQGRDNLLEDYNVRLAKQTITDITESAGLHVVEQEDVHRQHVMERRCDLPDSALHPDKACVFADGTMIHTQDDWREVRVMTVTAEDASGKLLARRSRARFLSVDEVAWDLTLLARGVGYQHARQRAFIADGAHWLWNIANQYLPSAVQILDWYHLAEKVHKAAVALFGEGSTAATDWAKQRKNDLWNGRSANALTAAREELARARGPTKRVALHELVTYLQNNEGRMDYPHYRSLGLPIGSGQVEAQCKTLVGARCKLAGMRNWTYLGAEGVLRMRAALHDGSYNHLWEQRLNLAA